MDTRQKVERPVVVAAEFECKFPNIYKHIEMARLVGIANGATWPAWCYIPIGGVQALFTEMGASQIDAVEWAASTTGLAAWRMGGKQVMLIHPEVQKALWHTKIEGDIPTDVLLHLPFWCVYVPLELDYVNLRGVFLHLEYDINKKTPELRMLIDLDETVQGEGGLIPALLEIDEKLPLETAIKKSYAGISEFGNTDRGLFGYLREFLAAGISIALYLCAKNTEMRTVSGNAPMQPIAKHRRMYAADKPTVWEAGWRIGAAIGAARQAVSKVSGSTGRTVRAHMRAAHWHTFRTGKGRTERIIHFLPPIPVGLPEDMDASEWANLLPATGRKA